jgi:hypothetical protein
MFNVRREPEAAAQATPKCVRYDTALAVVLNWLATHEGGGATDDMHYLSAMETPTLGPTLRGLGFTLVDYRFAFACAPLNPSLPIEAIVPERWYVTPSDHGL